MSRFVVIGAGRVATHLVPVLQAAGQEILQVYSRTLASAAALAERVGAVATDSWDFVRTDADMYLFVLADQALPTAVRALSDRGAGGLWLHTAGSMPLSVFAGSTAARSGVFYPMQTFSLERPVDFSRVSFFIEGDTADTAAVLTDLAHLLSPRVYQLDGEARRKLHLAAVWACNFANHCYALAAEVLRSEQLPFEVLLPLVDETTAKVHSLSPAVAQTGPAVRDDREVMARQMALLEGDPLRQEIYRLMSESIRRTAAAIRKEE